MFAWAQGSCNGFDVNASHMVGSSMANTPHTENSQSVSTLTVFSTSSVCVCVCSNTTKICRMFRMPQNCEWCKSSMARRTIISFIWVRCSIFVCVCAVCTSSAYSHLHITLFGFSFKPYNQINEMRTLMQKKKKEKKTATAFSVLINSYAQHQIDQTIHLAIEYRPQHHPSSQQT